MNSQEKQIMKDNSEINDKSIIKDINNTIKKQEKDIIDKKDNSIDEQNNEISCWGCAYDEPNQLAHMDIGGCLYSDSEE
jgi:hypothetical protein